MLIDTLMDMFYIQSYEHYIGFTPPLHIFIVLHNMQLLYTITLMLDSLNTHCIYILFLLSIYAYRYLIVILVGHVHSVLSIL
jgi:hypothetical protein